MDHAREPPPWLAQTGLSLDSQGFIRIAPTLLAKGRDDVFAAGDVISFAARELPKSGVYAVRAGPILADNIRRSLTGRALRPFRPQRKAMYLVSTGDAYAVGTRNGLVFKGAWVWRWKDWIDRRFMRRFNQLPEMAPARGRAGKENVGAQPLVISLTDASALKEISALAMRCGGCGAKIGATVLSRALAMIEPAPRKDVIAGLDAPDDAALIDTGGEKLSVQTVDYFRAMVDDPFLFGQIAANHALGDIYAMGGEPNPRSRSPPCPSAWKRRSKRIFPPCFLAPTRCCARRIVRWWAVTPARARSSRWALRSMASFAGRPPCARAERGRVMPSS